MAINFHGRPCFTPAVKNENFVSERTKERREKAKRRGRNYSAIN